MKKNLLTRLLAASLSISLLFGNQEIPVHAMQDISSLEITEETTETTLETSDLSLESESIEASYESAESESNSTESSVAVDESTMESDETIATSDETFETTTESSELELDPVFANESTLELYVDGSQISQIPSMNLPLEVFDYDQDLISTQDALPSKYDSRTLGLVTPVKNQNPFGTCWSFAFSNAMESAAIKQGLATSNTIDLSEFHLAYFTYHTGNDPTGNASLDEKKYIAYDENFKNYYLEQGGNASLAASTLMNWQGSASEAQFAYPNDRDSVPASIDSVHATDSNSLLLKNAYMLPTKANDDKTIQNVKQMIMNYGSVFWTYYDSQYYLNSSTAAYYCPTAQNGNHAISVIGWDDTYSKDHFKTKPSTDGAWIVKNSWSDTWGNEGYFYISYADATLGYTSPGYSDTVAVGCEVATTDAYDHLYFYGNTTPYAYYNVPKVAQVYQISGSNTQLINGVSIYLGSSSTTYQMQLYKNPTSSNGVVTNPASGTALLSTPLSGSFALPGVYTIDVPDIEVEPGDVVSCVLSFDKNTNVYLNTNYEQNFKKEDETLVLSEINVNHTEPGQSFINYGSGFHDLHSTNQSQTGSLMINMMTSDMDVNVPSLSVEPHIATNPDENHSVTLNWSSCPDATKYMVYRQKHGDNSFTKLADVTKDVVTYTDTTCTADAVYSYYVCSVVADITKESRHITVTLERPITFLSATYDDYTSVLLTWSSNSTVNTYMIYRSDKTDELGTKLTTITTAGTNSYTDTSVINGKTYYYTIVAKGSDQVEYTSDTKTVLIPPTAPVLSASYCEATGIALQWSIPTGITALTLEKSTDMETYTAFKQYQADANGNFDIVFPVYDTTAVVGTEYYYRITTQYRSLEGTTVAGKPSSVAYIKAMSDAELNTTYTIHFETNGKCDSINDLTGIKPGSSLDSTQMPTPVSNDAHYFFGGWYLDTACTKAWNYAKDTVNSNLTMYAKWIYLVADGFECSAISDFSYTGNPCKPEPQITYKGVILKKNADYSIVYQNNININSQGIAAQTGIYNASLPSVIIKGKGNYRGTLSVNFNIIPKNISDEQSLGSSSNLLENQPAQGITLKYTAQYITAKNKNIVPTVSLKYQKALTANKDYNLALYATTVSNGRVIKDARIGDNTLNRPSNGIYLLEIQGIGNYTGCIQKFLYVSDQTHHLSKATIKLGNNVKKMAYTGDALMPKAGWYDAATKTYYLIENGAVSIQTCDVKDIYTVNIGSTYLIQGKDYTVSYNDNVSVGKVTMTITGIGEYAGQKEITYNITGTPFSTKTVTISSFEDTFVYDGTSKIQSAATVSIKSADGDKDLVYGRDYKVTYSANTIYAGRVNVTFTALPSSGYSGSIKKTYTIKPATLADTMATPDTLKISAPYSKVGVTPHAEVVLTYNKKTLVEGVDYTLAYSNNKKPMAQSNGKIPTITVKGKKNFTGSIQIPFTILEGSFEDIRHQSSSVIFNPNAKSNYAYKPSVKLLDGKTALTVNKDYTITYTHNTQDEVKAYFDALSTNPSSAEALKPSYTVTPIAGSGYTGASVTMGLEVFSAKLDNTHTYFLVDPSVDSCTYTGSQVTPAIRVYYSANVSAIKQAKKYGVIKDHLLQQKYGLTLLDPSSYLITYGSNQKAGKNKGTVTIKGLAPYYGGSASTTFDIYRMNVDGTPDIDIDLLTIEISSQEKQILSLVNKERAKAKLPALKLDRSMQYAARLRCYELTQSFSNKRLDGSNWNTVLEEYDINAFTGFEYASRNYLEPSSAFNQWMKDSSYKEHILDPSITHVGISYAKTGSSKYASQYYEQIFLQK